MSKRSSLRRQLIAWNTLTLAVLLAVLGLATHFAAYRYALHSVDSELTERVKPPPGGPPPPRRLPDGLENSDAPGNLPNELGQEGPGSDAITPEQRGPEGPDGDPFGFGRGRPPAQGMDVRRPRVYSVDGVALQPGNTFKPFDPAALKAADEHSALVTTVTFDGEPYRVATRRLRRRLGIQSIPVVQAAYPLSDLNLATGALDRGLLALIPIGVLGAWLGATFLTRRVLGRVSKFAIAAEKMGEDDLSRRLPVDGNDEFADLAGTFNSLFSRLEEAFERQKAALEQQRRFTADASHELKTPLTVIKGTTSMALAGPRIDDRSREAFTEINQAADGMVKLVQDLLYLAKADSGALGADRQEVLAIEVLERAKASVSHLHGAPVTLGTISAEATLWGNEQELVRLFTNLLSNARRHTPESGRVQISVGIDHEVTQIVVADNGCGIAPDHLTKLGQRFFRADESRSRDDGGTGLGLAIVNEIVRIHQGTIQFQSALGKGTAVTVKLPAH